MEAWRQRLLDNPPKMARQFTYDEWKDIVMTELLGDPATSGPMWGFHLQHTEASKEKIRQAKLGKARPDLRASNLSDKNPMKNPNIVKARVFPDRHGAGNSRFGAVVSASTRKKISEANKGKLKGTTKSPETKAKMAAARKLFWDRKRKLTNAA